MTFALRDSPAVGEIPATRDREAVGEAAVSAAPCESRAACDAGYRQRFRRDGLRFWGRG
jgi:hypothetical protein